MDGFDSRWMGIGIAIGVIVGVLLYIPIGNVAVIYFSAVIGAVLGMNRGWFRRNSDKD